MPLSRRINIIGMANSRDTDGMRAYAEDSFQMLGVHEKPCKFIAVFAPEQNAKPTSSMPPSMALSIASVW